MKLAATIFISLILLSCVSQQIAADNTKAVVKFHGMEVEPYMVDGKRILNNQHIIEVKPGRHTVEVYLSWSGYSRSNATKSACFIAEGGHKYLVGADTGIENDKWYNSDWTPYIERISSSSLFIRFISLGFIRDLQNCE